MPSYLIVGASRGIGYAWLQYLSQHPANTVIGLARTPAPVEEQLAKDGIKNVHIIPGDMTSHGAMAKAAELANPLLPSGLDHLIVNGAHFGNAGFFLGPTDFSSAAQSQALHDDMHQSLDTNVLGTVYSINAFLPLVLKGTAKKIVAITTGWADPDLSRPADDGAEGLSFAMVYSAMKAALNMIIAKYAAELQSQGVITLALSPGVVNTPNNQPTPEIMGPMMKMIGVFKRYYPSFEGPATPLASVEDQKKVIDSLTIADTGKFLSHHGNKEWL